MKGHLGHITDDYNHSVILNRCIQNYTRNNKIVDVLNTSYLKYKRCFIIGGGESVKLLDLSRLENEIVITINLGFLCYPKSKLNYMMDSDLVDRIKSGVLNTRHNVEVDRLWREYSGYKIYLCPIETKKFDSDIYVINRFREIDISYDLNRGIHGADNSGYGALMLSIVLGCKEIYLLGYDMKAVNQTHWHKGYDDRNIDIFNSKLSEYCNNIKAIAPRLKNDGIKVYNCSNNSNLHCFDYKEFNEVFNEPNVPK